MKNDAEIIVNSLIGAGIVMGLALFYGIARLAYASPVIDKFACIIFSCAYPIFFFTFMSLWIVLSLKKTWTEKENVDE